VARPLTRDGRSGGDVLEREAGNGEANIVMGRAVQVDVSGLEGIPTDRRGGDHQKPTAANGEGGELFQIGSLLAMCPRTAGFGGGILIAAPL
jgi:hypothetical protein